MKKTLSILLLTICLVFCSTCVMAFDKIETDEEIKNFGNGGAATTANTIIGVVQWIGYAIAVGMLVFIGIKYVMASADEKASLKNASIKYIVGAVLIAGAATIAGWVFDIM